MYSELCYYNSLAFFNFTKNARNIARFRFRTKVGKFRIGYDVFKAETEKATQCFWMIRVIQV